MYEKKYADSYDMNIEKIHNSIMRQMLETEKFELFNEEDYERERALENRINNIPTLDESFKKSFNGDMQDTMVTASFNSFENGLNIGLSLLWNILNAELPEIHITHLRRVPEKPNNEIIKEFSRVCENMPLREQVHIMTMIYEYEEKYNEGILTEI